MSFRSGYLAATSKAGLARLVGCDVRTVGSKLGGGGITVREGLEEDEVWFLGEVELVKVVGRGISGKGGVPVTSTDGTKGKGK